MLKGFEQLTEELSANEKTNLLPMVLSKVACHKGKADAITNRELVEYCGCRGQKVAEPRIRKIIEYIRQSRLIDGLVATSTGYFIATNPDELLNWVESMKSRRNALDVSIHAAMQAHHEITRKNKTGPGIMQQLF